MSTDEGVTIVTLADAAYPQALRTIHEPPQTLHIRGSVLPADAIAVAVVGARHASLYGLQCAERLSYELALRGITVVSGLARGIDAAAHRGCLKAGGRTLAVLGSGLGRIYPPEHQELAAQIARQGAVLSEYPMDMQPFAGNFPRRNRLISGLALGVVIVEASRRSGALITADCALEQGREVFAVPGPMTSVTSQGTHELLKQGARLVTSVEDILDELRLVAQPAREAQPQHLAGPPRMMAEAAAEPEALRTLDGRVFACVRPREPRSIDAIADESGLSLPEVSSTLLRLELKQVIRQLPGKQFVRADR
jgi:DNA processing protein